MAITAPETIEQKIERLGKIWPLAWTILGLLGGGAISAAKYYAEWSVQTAEAKEWRSQNDIKMQSVITTMQGMQAQQSAQSKISDQQSAINQQVARGLRVTNNRLDAIDHLGKVLNEN